VEVAAAPGTVRRFGIVTGVRTVLGAGQMFGLADEQELERGQGGR